MAKRQTVEERVLRIESKLTRYITEQQVLNARLAKMLDEWDEFKREWDDEGAVDDEDSGFNFRITDEVPTRAAQ